MTRPRRPAGDDGVVAIVVALCVATFLLVMGAFAVDFGNAFARRQNLQTSVDLAALAGAAMLPDRAAALGKIHDSLCHGGNENTVYGWDPSVCTGNGWMDDADPDNGEVTFFAHADADGRYRQPAGAGAEATALRVVTPKAHVDFGLGQITGASGVDLVRAATAKMGSLTGPGGVQPIPVTPDEPGAICLSDTPGTTTGTGGVTIPAQSPQLALSLDVLQDTNITPGQPVTVRVLTDLGVQVGGVGITARVRLVSSTGTVSPVPVTWNAALGGYTFPAYPYGTLPAHIYVVLELDLTIGTIITGWQEITYAGQDPCGAAQIRRNHISEPRFTGTGLTLLLNLNAGIDHPVRPWSEYPPGNLPATVPEGQCNVQPGTAFRSGGSPLSTVNCLTVRNDVDVVGEAHPPYLDLNAYGPGLLMRNSCPNSDRGDINGHADRDVTSMFRADFTPGGPSGTIAGLIRAGASPTAAQQGSLSPELLLCPRLFTVPVLDAPIVDRAIGAGSYPVQGFRYLYLEPSNTGGASYGFTFSNRTVTRINAIVIDPAWFPKTASLPLPVGEYLGENLTKQVALVHDSDDPGT